MLYAFHISTMYTVTHLQIRPEQVSRDGDVAAGVTEDASTDATMVFTDKHIKLDSTIRTLLAGFVGHPVLTKVGICVLQIS